MEIKLPFGLRNGAIVHISEINENEQGLKCNCFCSNCGQKLNSKLESEKISYFTHVNNNCKDALEITLRKFAKELLEKNGKIKLPELCLVSKDSYKTKESKYETINETIVAKDYYLHFDSIMFETRLDYEIPDIVVYKNNIPLLIWVTLAHFINEGKVTKIKKMGISAIEVTLSSKNIDYSNFNRTVVENIIINETETKTWIFNNKAELKKKSITAQQKKLYKRTGKWIEDRFSLDSIYDEGAPGTLSHVYNKSGTCRTCGKETTDWIVYYGEDGTCICRRCRLNEDK